MEKKLSINTFRAVARKLLLWGLRIAAVVIMVLVVRLATRLWQQLSDAQPRTTHNQPSGPDLRGIGEFNINDTVTHHQEAIRWVNLFLEDIIITSNHPQQLRVESAPAVKEMADVAPDDAPSRDGHAMSAEWGDEKPPVHRRRHHGGDDEDADSVAERHLSLRASLQPFKRVGALVRYPVGSRWSLEAGLTYGSLKTADNRNACLAIPLKAVYDIKPLGAVDLYALGGGTVEKVCKGGTSLQLLLQAGIGAEYHFHKKWGVFLEPSLRYHVGNDNNIPELYGKRLGMNIHLGVSFTP